MPGQKEHSLVHDILPWVIMNGGDFVSSDKSKSLLNTDNSIQGLNFYFNLASSFAPENITEIGFGEVMTDFFLYGNYAMHFSGTWASRTFLNQTNPIAKNICCTYLPKGPVKRCTFLGGSNLVITSFSKYPDEAFEFVKFLCSPESVNRYCKSIGMLPPHLENFDFSIARIPKKIIMKSFRTGIKLPKLPLWGTIEVMIIESIHKIFGHIQNKDYNIQLLRNEMNTLSKEIDYVLTLLESRC